MILLILNLLYWSILFRCFHRFLPVFGVGLDPDTALKEVNYTCFGRIG
jgi:hypothetical protein